MSNTITHFRSKLGWYGYILRKEVPQEHIAGRIKDRWIKGMKEEWREQKIALEWKRRDDYVQRRLCESGNWRV